MRGGTRCKERGSGARPWAPGDASPPRPQEEETLSFIRDSLEKSDQLTRNMVSNPSAGRGCRPPDPAAELCDLAGPGRSVRPGVLARVAMVILGGFLQQQCGVSFTSLPSPCPPPHCGCCCPAGWSWSSLHALPVVSSCKHLVRLGTVACHPHSR